MKRYFGSSFRSNTHVRRVVRGQGRWSLPVKPVSEKSPSIAVHSPTKGCPLEKPRVGALLGEL